MIITSFGPQGYQDYARDFLTSFIEYWGDERLIVYCEQIEPDFPEDPRIEYRNMANEKVFRDFIDRIAASDPMFSGVMRNPNKPDEKTYNFRFDAGKFCRKVFAIYHCAQFRNTNEPLAWLDADVVFHRKLPVDYIRELLGGQAVAYLGRPNMYSECGFMAWDVEHHDFDLFMRLYWNVYRSGAFRMLSEWHDCQVFDIVRETLGVSSRNLAKGCDPNHPFVYSCLGMYCDHKKGARKAMDESPERKEIPA